MKLSEGKEGTTYRVVSISVNEQTEHRLEALGMMIGTPVAILHRKRTGTMIIDLRGTRFALGSKLTERIEVEA
ncbi:FeoA family protein [Catenisphaera adipataccumulans]|jgi:ferrous iron transport protein A|uniref:Ferrous iron transport protein A n=1 Tax=Catenisphaera adipataccumulans TaxID=700500 RepID=A0A7W8D0I0_9FIRM|nr:FeoA family protein [Catenisphaera adipataccumulans]MBB5183767.1 ferrous iron transport protein A [Catenisphaera adipataccumulans]